MIRIIYLVIFSIVISAGCQQQESVERYIEDGIAVIHNPLEPVKNPTKIISLKLELDFVIDSELAEIAETGLSDIRTFDVDDEGNIYILSLLKAEFLIHKFSEKGEHILSFGRKGQGPGELSGPSSLFIRLNNNLFVTDARGLKLVNYDRISQLENEIPFPFRINVILP